MLLNKLLGRKRVELLVLADVYKDGINFDNITGEKYEEEERIAHAITLKTMLILSNKDEFREYYNVDENRQDPKWTVITRLDIEGSMQEIVVAHSYDHIKNIYHELDNDKHE